MATFPLDTTVVVCDYGFVDNERATGRIWISPAYRSVSNDAVLLPGKRAWDLVEGDLEAVVVKDTNSISPDLFLVIEEHLNGTPKESPYVVKAVDGEVNLATAERYSMGDLVHPLLPSMYLQTAQRGVPNGVASLGNDGKVPTSQLPPGSGGGAVDSVNEQTGEVVLSAEDVGADPEGSSAAALASAAQALTDAFAAHNGAGDPHAQYMLDSMLGLGVAPSKGLVYNDFSTKANGPVGLSDSGYEWGVTGDHPPVVIDGACTVSAVPGNGYLMGTFPFKVFGMGFYFEFEAGSGAGSATMIMEPDGGLDVNNLGPHLAISKTAAVLQKRVDGGPIENVGGLVTLDLQSGVKYRADMFIVGNTVFCLLPQNKVIIRTDAQMAARAGRTAVWQVNAPEVRCKIHSVWAIRDDVNPVLPYLSPIALAQLLASLFDALGNLQSQPDNTNWKVTFGRMASGLAGIRIGEGAGAQQILQLPTGNPDLSFLWLLSPAILYGPNASDSLAGMIDVNASMATHTGAADPHPQYKQRSSGYPLDRYGFKSATYADPHASNQQSTLGGGAFFAELVVNAGDPIASISALVRVAGTVGGGGLNGFSVYEGGNFVIATPDDDALWTMPGWRTKVLAAPIAAQSAKRVVLLGMACRGYSVDPNIAYQVGPIQTLALGGVGTSVRRAFFAGISAWPASIDPNTFGDDAGGYLPFIAIS